MHEKRRERKKTLFLFVSLRLLSQLSHNSLEFLRNTFIWLLSPSSNCMHNIHSAMVMLAIEKSTFLFYYCNFCANDKKYWSTVMQTHFDYENCDNHIFDKFGLSAKHWKLSSYIRELIIVIVRWGWKNVYPFLITKDTKTVRLPITNFCLHCNCAE